MAGLSGTYYDRARGMSVKAEYVPENGKYLVYNANSSSRDPGQTLTESQLRRAIDKGELQPGGRDPLLSGNLEDLL